MQSAIDRKRVNGGTVKTNCFGEKVNSLGSHEVGRERSKMLRGFSLLRVKISNLHC